MDTSNSLISGSCLCEAVQYTLANGYGMTVLCHCNSCRKASGSSFMANSFCEKKNLSITAGMADLRTYRDTRLDSGGFIDRAFCVKCGSPLFAENEKKFPGHVIITMGTMEDVQGLNVRDVNGGRGEWKPMVEYYCKRKAGWYNNLGTQQKTMLV